MSEKCSPDDPRRCQGVTDYGQCNYIAGEGEQFCRFHSNGKSTKRAETKEKQRYIIDRAALKEAYQRQLDDESYLDMRNEIALIQGMVERRINLATTEVEELMAIRDTERLVSRLESMKISLMKIQKQLGLVLGKTNSGLWQKKSLMCWTRNWMASKTKSNVWKIL